MNAQQKNTPALEKIELLKNKAFFCLRKKTDLLEKFQQEPCAQKQDSSPEETIWKNKRTRIVKLKKSCKRNEWPR